jgi:hypothetical protein
MSPSGPALGSLIQTNVDSLMAAVTGKTEHGIAFKGVHPLLQKNPQYFIELCNAIGEGLIEGGPVIDFTTLDTGLGGSPFVEGVGAGLGILINKDFFRENAYTNIRNAIIARYGRTTHDPYLPRPYNTGQFLDAICNGVAISVYNYYQTVWTLTSAHPEVYMGTGLIEDGDFYGISADPIAGAIRSHLPNFRGDFYPEMVQGIADAYVLTITTQATGTVTITGTCDESVSQRCGLQTTGSGSV